jgi:hypothetical protein
MKTLLEIMTRKEVIDVALKYLKKAIDDLQSKDSKHRDITAAILAARTYGAVAYNDEGDEPLCKDIKTNINSEYGDPDDRMYP